MLTGKLKSSFYDYAINNYNDIEVVERILMDFENKFNLLSKYDQLELSFIMESNNWELAIEYLDKWSK